MECNFTLCRFNTEYEVNKKGVCKCKSPERFCKYLQLEKKNAKLESDFRICEENTDAYYDQRTKAKEILREYIRINLMPPIERNFDDEVKLFKQAEQFLSEVEK